MNIFFGLILSLSLVIVQQNQSNYYDNYSPDDFSKYICYTTNEKIVIDGKLNEESWEMAPTSNSFVDIQGGDKPAPLHDTKFRMLWDQEYLYIGARLEEPNIWATYTKRESIIFHENDFEIFIDPNGDTHNYYEIEVNAINTIWDLLLTKPYRDRGKAVNSWNVEGMKSAVYLKGTNNDPSDLDEYWTVEFALPWSALKEYAFENRKPRDNEQWRMNFSRVQWKLDITNGEYSKRIDPKTEKSFPEDNWVWSPQGAINMHQPETWGYVQFSDSIVGHSKTEFLFSKDEYCKWELRKIYYAQKAYRKEHGDFTINLGDLDYKNEYCPDASIELTVSESNFQATLHEAGGTTTWKIGFDGLIWYE